MEILTTRPSKIPGEKGIIDETGAQIVTPKSTRITEMVKTATELETAIPLEEPPKAGVLLSAYIPVSFTTKGYIPTDNVEKSQSSAKTMKPPSPPLKKTNSSTSLSNLDIIEDVMSKKTGTLNFLGIDGLGTKGEPQPPPMSPKTFKRRTKACIVDDLSKHKKIDVDDLIQKLMTSVSKDGVVTNHLQDVAVIEQICVLAM
uniref:Uncharacterized protein n=1 Tax=Panagrolaimus sp. JU765 TaxID=591449 RepID=A0AC34QUV5_9BILA